MEEYILISWLNDFIFCPASIYFHTLYEDRERMTYQTTVQTKGTNSHETVDSSSYSKSKHILQGMDVCSNEYGIYGKIDMYNTKTKTLTERKRKIVKIYDGYIFQLYAQYFCLKEMGFDVEKIAFYSYVDNKKYNVLLPEEDNAMYEKFTNILKEMKEFSVSDYMPTNQEKCNNCIYNNICDRSLSAF